MQKVYLDHAATSPMHPSVIDKQVSVMNNTFGNPSSIHSYGREARHLLDESRTIIADSLNADFNEIIFTSGGTEADNMAIMGVAEARKNKGKHIITTQIEHHAVLHVCNHLEEKGFEVTYLPVDKEGRISLEELKNELREDTILVTIMFGNNEVGTVQPIQEIGELVKDHPAYFHTDAVQAYGLTKIDVKALHIDLLSVSAHKINGPKGIGFLYSQNDVPLTPSLFGGEQERKRRAGTENVASIAAFAEAVTIAQATRTEKLSEYEKFANTLIGKLTESPVEFSRNGSLEHYLPHVVNLSFPGTDVESLLVNLDMSGIAVSSGSACTAGSIEPSHVLVAMFGKESDKIRNSIRFSFGLHNTTDQVDYVVEELIKIVTRLTR
ncbi:cysteine desulfurase family protein [Bacillus seohaeanensis]|jgi:cysteine desulfurase|uniref:cysteine desulfurase n=1 Tax=Bacillus seohaeanensis TaxID=284580 RepID=A0ABW5RRS6_9BACI